MRIKIFALCLMLPLIYLCSCAKKEYPPAVAFKGEITNIGLKYCPKCGAILATNATKCSNPKCKADIKISEIKLSDTRIFEVLCPKCAKPIGIGVEKCPNETCRANIKWGNIKCGFCNGSGTCSACEALQQKDGKCFNCQGRGYLDCGADCPNCAGTGKCPICTGTGKCNYCAGKGFFTAEELKAKVPKAAEEEESQ